MIAVVLGVNFSLDALLNAGYDGGLGCGQCSTNRNSYLLLQRNNIRHHCFPWSSHSFDCSSLFPVGCHICCFTISFRIHTIYMLPLDKVNSYKGLATILSCEVVECLDSVCRGKSCMENMQFLCSFLMFMAFAWTRSFHATVEELEWW